MRRSLQSSCGVRMEVYLLWIAAVYTLAKGLSLPVITITELVFRKNTYSVLGGVIQLYNHKDYVLAAVIFIFSFLFPILKLLSLLFLWFMPVDPNARKTVVTWLGHLGKWSMLDVYVVALTILIAKSSTLLKAKPEMGIYYFGASVVLSILTSTQIERLSKKCI